MLPVTQTALNNKGATMGLFDIFKSSSPASHVAVDSFVFKPGADTCNGVTHLQWAREAVKAGDMSRARVEYLKAVEGLRQTNEAENGRFEAEHAYATKEYATFVERDPAYINGLAELQPIIQSNSGILQTDLYNACPGLDRETISYILYFAASKGVIERTKKGRTYELRIK